MIVDNKNGIRVMLARWSRDLFAGEWRCLVTQHGDEDNNADTGGTGLSDIIAASAVGLSKTYGVGDAAVRALDNVSIGFRAHELTAIVGASGSGKSTLLHCMSGFSEPDSGYSVINGVRVQDLEQDAGKTKRRNKRLSKQRRVNDDNDGDKNGDNVLNDAPNDATNDAPNDAPNNATDDDNAHSDRNNRHLLTRPEFRRRTIGFIFQQYGLIPVLTCRENILLPLSLDDRKYDPEEFSRVTRVLGLDDRLEHMPSELSGGQQQKTALARVLLQKPPVVLADEPTGSLDVGSTSEVLRLLRSMVDDMGLTVIMVTHSMDAAILSDRGVVLSDGRVVADIDSPVRSVLEDAMTMAASADTDSTADIIGSIADKNGNMIDSSTDGA